MKNKHDETSEGLNQLVEIINAKGDTGELKEIVDKAESSHKQKQELHFD